MEDAISLRVDSIIHIFSLPQQDSEKMQKFKDAIAAQTNYSILVSKALPGSVRTRQLFQENYEDAVISYLNTRKM